jgi:hypothetical protein
VAPAGLFGHQAGNGAPEFPYMPGILSRATGTDFSVVLDKLHPELSHLFLQFDIRELLDFLRP